MTEPHDPTHHDGIVEHDNHLPNWWLATLFGSIVFAGVYWLYYHTLSIGALQAQELKADETVLASKRQAAAPPLSDESLLAASKDAQALDRGAQLFKANCVACHGAQGEGVVGPNLTDDAWLHGSSPMAIHGVISRGVVDKGMLAWGPVLGADKVMDVTAFVLSLKGKNIPGKAPQGQP